MEPLLLSVRSAVLAWTRSSSSSRECRSASSIRRPGAQPATRRRQREDRDAQEEVEVQRDRVERGVMNQSRRAREEGGEHPGSHPAQPGAQHGPRVEQRDPWTKRSGASERAARRRDRCERAATATLTTASPSGSRATGGAASSKRPPFTRSARDGLHAQARRSGPARPPIRPHLRHHVAALLLDGGLAGPELGRDLLVEQAGDDAAITSRSRGVGCRAVA